MIAGQMRPGDPFPSVRVLSKELKINPNTAHKVVTYLVTTGLLETRPGIGTVVAVLPEASAAERTQLLGREIEALVVEAKKLGITLEDMVASIGAHWKRLGGDAMPSNQATPSESSSSELRSGESGRGGRGKR
jgi:GntR family transcriptional regulator